MLKSLNRCTILTKIDNGIIVCVREIHDRKKTKMNNHQDQGQNLKYFAANESANINNFRKWVQVSQEPKKPGFALSLLNYNILAQNLLETHSYLYHDHYDRSALRWNQRFYSLVGEILFNKPDILCCQVS
jgi:mRNA deadenylase 3'-5' endonuclease subunit Ccr4